MDKLYDQLALFNFTKTESQIYIALLQCPQINGSKLAKIVNLPRSTVYNSLNNLQNRGAAILIPGDINVYRAEEPELLFNRLKEQLSRSADEIKDELSRISIKKPTEGFANISGYENALSKTREFLISAEKEVYFDTNIDLSLFKEELLELNRRGIRVIVFTSNKVNGNDLPVELFYADKFNMCGHPYSKLMMVVDQKKALISQSMNDDTNGVYSNNPILIDLVSEHIHLDIYLHRLEKKHGVKNIVTDDILLNSFQEEQHKSKLK